MALTPQTVTALLVGTASKTAGNEIASALNQGLAAAAQDLYVQPALIVATSVSPTVNFGALTVGDVVVHIPAVAGNSNFLTVATAGTLPAAAVVGDLYIVIRSFAPPAASAAVL